nr:DUF397 domain-containing protein [Streptomyces sp. NBC_00857]
MSSLSGLAHAQWVKSSYSNGNGGGCVEWAPNVAVVSRIVPVRDSKAPAGPALTFTADGWATFVAAVSRTGFPAP